MILDTAQPAATTRLDEAAIIERLCDHIAWRCQAEANLAALRRRVDQLLEANNAEVERRRRAEGRERVLRDVLSAAVESCVDAPAIDGFWARYEAAQEKQEREVGYLHEEIHLLRKRLADLEAQPARENAELERLRGELNPTTGKLLYVTPQGGVLMRAPDVGWMPADVFVAEAAQ